MKRKSFLVGLAMWLGHAISSPAIAGGVVVIVNKSNASGVDRPFISSVYLGKKSYWQNGSPVLVLAQNEESESHAMFCKDVLGKNPVVVKTLWAQNIFSGRKLPPKVADPDAEIKRLVQANPNAIGYIRAESLDDSVKAVFP